VSLSDQDILAARALCESGVDSGICTRCDLPVEYSETSDKDDDEVCRRYKPYCRNDDHAVDWRARAREMELAIADSNHERAGIEGELLGLRVSEAFFRNRAEVLEASTVRALSERERDSMKGCCPLCALSPHDYLDEAHRQRDLYKEGARSLRSDVERLTRERDEWRDACQAISDLFDPLHHKALPHSALIVSRSAKDAHLAVRSERDRLRALLLAAVESAEEYRSRIYSRAELDEVGEDPRLASIRREGGVE
jgi:hypothetical protein